MDPTTKFIWFCPKPKETCQNRQPDTNMRFLSQISSTFRQTPVGHWDYFCRISPKIHGILLSETSPSIHSWKSFDQFLQAANSFRTCHAQKIEMKEKWQRLWKNIMFHCAIAQSMSIPAKHDIFEDNTMSEMLCSTLYDPRGFHRIYRDPMESSGIHRDPRDLLGSTGNQDPGTAFPPWLESWLKISCVYQWFYMHC